MSEEIQFVTNLTNAICILRLPTDSGIGSWDWNLKGDSSTYHALYPRSWTIYEGNLHYLVLYKSNCCLRPGNLFFFSYLVIQLIKYR